MTAAITMNALVKEYPNGVSGQMRWICPSTAASSSPS